MLPSDRMYFVTQAHRNKTMDGWQRPKLIVKRAGHLRMPYLQ